MSANSLYGKLVADLANEYRHQCDALHAHPQQINRFGEAIKPFGLAPHIKPNPSGGISMCATSSRGENADDLIAAMKTAGFHVGATTPLPQQFNDGFVMWTAPVRGAGLDFTLLVYTAADAP
jgi:hypothetical protein